MTGTEAPTRSPPTQPVAPAWRVPTVPARRPRREAPPTPRRAPPPPPSRDGCDEYAQGAGA